MAAWVLGICFTLASSSQALPVFVATERFTLAWTHSIEKQRWEEDYAVVPGNAPGQPPVLQALQARIKGSGAGMEPPPDAVLHNGWYVYTPTTTTVPELLLTRSEFTPDYDWCLAGRCQPLSNVIASDSGVTRAKPCFGMQ